jgi:hypothetical protein
MPSISTLTGWGNVMHVSSVLTWREPLILLVCALEVTFAIIVSVNIRRRRRNEKMTEAERAQEDEDNSREMGIW